MKSIKKQTPTKIITLGFMAVILTGSFLLMLLVCVKSEVNLHYVDVLFTSTSAVRVAELIITNTADTCTALGQAIVASLIQIGDLRVTSVGMSMILALGCRVNLKECLLIEETMNLDPGRGIVCIVKNVLKITLCFERTGAVLNYPVFSRDYPPLKIPGISPFHSVAVFSNPDFNILGGLQNLTGYKDNILLNLTTSGLITFGDLGSPVIMDIAGKHSFKELCLHSKTVTVTTLILLVVGTVPLRLTEDITWLGAFFTSASAETAGLTTFPLSDFTVVGLLTVTVLAFISALSGSTGGGTKTNTLFTLFHTIKGVATNTQLHAFHYKIPQEALYKTVIMIAPSPLVVISGILCMCVLGPGLPSEDIMLEITSTFGAVKLSTGITPGLNPLSKLLKVLIVYVGRLGPSTIVATWIFKPDTSVSFPEESISIG